MTIRSTSKYKGILARDQAAIAKAVLLCFRPPTRTTGSAAGDSWKLVDIHRKRAARRAKQASHCTDDLRDCNIGHALAFEVARVPAPARCTRESIVQVNVSGIP